MNLLLMTEEQKQIKALIKQFCEKEVEMKWVEELTDKATAAKTIEDVRAIYPKDLMEKLHKVGLRQLCVPIEYGGGGASRFGSVTRAIAAEQLGYSIGIAARLLSIPWMHCAAMAGYGATKEQQDWFFKQYMEDHNLDVALALSEPQGQGDVQSVAYKDGKEWVINGDKMFSSGAPVASLIRVVARTDKQNPMARTDFWVRKDVPGLTHTLNRFVICEITGNSQTHWDNVRVPEECQVGELHKGDATPYGGEIVSAKMLMYSDVLGHCQRVYDGVVDYAKQRVRGGKPIIKHTKTAAMLGDAAINIEMARSYIYRVAAEYDEREKAGGAIEISMEFINHVRC